MATVGSFVKHRGELTAGLVLRWDEQNPGCVIVRTWDRKDKQYVDRVFHPTWLISIETWDEFERLHNTGEDFKQIHREVAMELALVTKDESWFNELLGVEVPAKEGESV